MSDKMSKEDMVKEAVEEAKAKPLKLKQPKRPEKLKRPQRPGGCRD